MKRNSAFIAVSCLFAVLLCQVSQGQNDATKADAATKLNSQVEVLTRGPLHEAFATQFQTNATAGVQVDKEPPQMIEEIPPAVRPAGAGVTWIPGYWGWDAEAKDFLWVSGTWRNAPPGHRWVPGYWNKSDAGFQWMSGFWLRGDVGQIKYYAAPPKSVERGPTSNAPGANYFWVPGSFTPARGKYAWQPGYWAPYQQNYLWTPARNVATAGGYVFTPGYWDYRFDQRGMVFAPVRVNGGANANANIRFTPQAVIPANVLQFHLFGQANSNTYLFGNYYDARYANAGIRPWYTGQIVKGVPDPLFGYYNWLYSRNGSNYLDVLTKWNGHFVNNVNLRPALTLADQLNLAQTEQGAKNLANSLLATPLTDLVSRTPAGFVNVSAAESTNLLAAAGGLQALATERLKVEGGAAGILNVAGAANSNIDLSTQSLPLPAVSLPAIPANTVPAVPSELLKGVPDVVPNVVPDVEGVVPDLPGIDLPGLPF